MLSMMYETMLLFGVLFLAVWLFSALLEQRHALYLRNLLQNWLFLVLGLYFVWFWTHGGQTLPMKTWRIKLVSAFDNGPVGARRAIARYLIAWAWVLPGLAIAWTFGAKDWMLVVIPLLNIVLWASTVYLDPQRQFLHDRIAGTKLVTVENDFADLVT
jgi:uncharacterized RDD family membrane protein YckC